MNTTQPKIRTLGGKWPRFVIVRESPEPDAHRQYWDGTKWVEDLRAALLYACQKSIRQDLKTMRRPE